MAVKTVGKDLPSDPKGHLNKYYSVSICCVADACPAAKALAGERHLVDEAPKLPLSTCLSSSCTCRYALYRDRRSFLTNRRSNSRLETLSHKKIWQRNRRAGADRRSLKVNFNLAGSIHPAADLL